MASVTSWCLAFPYAPNEPIRAEAFQIIHAFYERHFPETPQLVRSATPIGEPFLRARTRNELVRQAEQQGFDIVCLIDADTLIHPDGIRRTVHRVTETPGLIGKPFLRGCNLPLAEQRKLATDPAYPWPRGRFADPGASWIIRPATWWRAGGMDEGYTSWGGEDNSLQYLHEAVGGTVEYDRLPVVKTEHPTLRWSNDPAWQETFEREAICRWVWKHPDLADEWLTVRYRPGIVTEWIDQLGLRESVDQMRAAQKRRRERLDQLAARRAHR